MEKQGGRENNHQPGYDEDTDMPPVSTLRRVQNGEECKEWEDTEEADVDR